PVYWPDFDEHELRRALDAYAGRDRRFGRVPVPPGAPARVELRGPEPTRASAASESGRGEVAPATARLPVPV
ncbi:MAG TPA: hypothetical protein VH257_06050, partial [Chloroflexota bacterium]|nr:hypothetical protein [Chloroflexota bacterium]